MKNTKWVFDKKLKRHEWIYKPNGLLIGTIYLEKGRYELPENWFGRTKKFKLKSKKSLPAAKTACEKWLNDFITSIK